MAGILLSLGSVGFAASCDNLTGDLFGLCNAFCVAKVCQTSNPNGSAESCNLLSEKFLKRAGYPLPCLEKPAIIVLKKTNGIIYNPTSELKLVVGESVNWSYSIRNLGNVPITINSVVDFVQVGSEGNPNVTCSPALPTSIGPNNLLECYAQGVVGLGTYVNEVVVHGISSQGTNVTARATASYFGVNPGISIKKTASAPSATVEQNYSWNFEVANTGTVPLTNIGYQDSAFPNATVNCPQSLGPQQVISCSSEQVGPSQPTIIENKVDIVATYTDGAGKLHRYNDSSTASISFTLPPIVCPQVCVQGWTNFIPQIRSVDDLLCSYDANSSAGSIVLETGMFNYFGFYLVYGSISGGVCSFSSIPTTSLTSQEQAVCATAYRDALIHAGIITASQCKITP